MSTPGSEKVSRRHALAGALRRLPPLLLQTDSRLTLLVTGMQIVQTLVPVAQLWVFKLIVDRLVRALRGPHPTQANTALLQLVAIELILGVAGLVLREAIDFGRTLLAERLTIYVNTRILAHAQQLDLATLERPAYHDRLQRAEESSLHRPAGLLFRLLDLVQGGVTLLALVVVLERLHPLAAPVLLLTALPYGWVRSRAAVDAYSLSTAQTPETRRARYFSRLLSTDSTAKELRVFGSSDFLLSRYREILIAHEQQMRGLARRASVGSVVSGLLPVLAYAGIYAYFSLQALSGHITVGDLTLYAGIILRSQDVLQQTMAGLSGMVEHSLFLDDYFAFLALESAMPTQPGNRRPPSVIQQGVRFEEVEYRYAQSDSAGAALSKVCLELPVGETVAIVGENGAGKTTIVKLLARLYDPTAGRITIDGIDLRELDPRAWQQQIAVIFQDFVQYYLSAAANIGLGQVQDVDNMDRIESAARRAGADEAVRRLPQGYQTILGSWFGDGVQLSGGEWQRLALARAFMRDAPILVLDEPTAGLDARGEYEVFRRFRELAQDRTVLLISHRFSTVRMADRIYVLKQGQIVETGNHEELLRQGGQYADLFQMQAAGYR